MSLRPLNALEKWFLFNLLVVQQLPLELNRLYIDIEGYIRHTTHTRIALTLNTHEQYYLVRNRTVTVFIATFHELFRYIFLSI